MQVFLVSYEQIGTKIIAAITDFLINVQAHSVSICIAIFTLLVFTYMLSVVKNLVFLKARGKKFVQPDLNEVGRVKSSVGSISHRTSSKVVGAARERKQHDHERVSKGKDSIKEYIFDDSSEVSSVSDTSQWNLSPKSLKVPHNSPNLSPKSHDDEQHRIISAGKSSSMKDDLSTQVNGDL